MPVSSSGEQAGPREQGARVSTDLRSGRRLSGQRGGPQTYAQDTHTAPREWRDRNGKKERAPCMNKLHTTTSTNQGLQLSKTKIKDARQRTRDEDDTLLCSKEHMRWPPLPLPHCSTRLHAGAAIAASRSAASIASSSSSGSSTAAPPRPTTASLWLCLCAGRGRFKPGPPSPE